MNWFKRMVIGWVREDWNSTPKLGGRGNYPQEIVASSDDSDSVSGDPVLNFRVYSAIGGRIVEFRRYDRARGNHETAIYIITEDQNFGERIAKIATIENLKA